MPALSPLGYVAMTGGLKGDQRDVEFDKCKVAPMTDKRIEELVNDSTDNLE